MFDSISALPRRLAKHRDKIINIDEICVDLTRDTLASEQRNAGRSRSRTRSLTPTQGMAFREPSIAAASLSRWLFQDS